MSHPYHHACSTAKRWGGKPEDYQHIHDWFDATKACCPDPRHRSMRHHSEGIFLCEQVFGTVVVNSDGKAVPVRVIGEQHVMEDLGWIPTMMDWLQYMHLPAKMNNPQKISRKLQEAEF